MPQTVDNLDGRAQLAGDVLFVFIHEFGEREAVFETASFSQPGSRRRRPG
jgi:hypothetical protein